jgi:PhnB protein
MARSLKPIPDEFHSVTPQLVVKGAAQAIEFYKKAFGAEERSRMASPDGKIMHAELKIGDSIIFLADEMPNPGGAKSPQTLGACTATLHVYVPDVDSAFRKAISAGGKETMAVADQFWGDRYGSFTDPYGHSWGVATRKEDLGRKEVEERAREFFGSVHRKTA